MERIPQNQIAGNTPSEALSLILSKVTYTRSGEGYSFRCPAHDDKRNSAYVKADAKGNVILKCFAGCSRKAICEALGITESDLYAQKASTYTASQTTARYRYYDEAGKFLYEHLRLVDGDGKKTFLYCRTDATGNSLWTLYSGWFELKGRTWKRIEGANDPHNKPKASARWFDESKRVLYRLSALRKAQPGTLALYCEGEKDVENAEALGFVATTAGSASDWRPEFAGDLTDFDLVIIPDNDEAGHKCAAKVARDCYGKAARVRVLALPGLGKGGDLSDWIKAGGTKEKLLAMLSAASGQDVHLKEASKIILFDSLNSPHNHLNEVPESIGTGVAEGGNALPPSATPVPAFFEAILATTGSHEIDLSELQEVEDDDPPISSDPRREAYLRQLARNAAKVIDACCLILQQLGFEKDHTRLLMALITLGGDRLNYFQAYHANIRERYAARREASSAETVKRDLKLLRTEQEALGVIVVSYQPGFKVSSIGEDGQVKEKGFPCRFQNCLLRYALQAINISIDTRADFKTARLALKAACEIVIESIPRVEKKEPKAKDKKKKNLTVEDLEARLGAMQEQLLEIMVADGWSDEEMEEEIELQHRRFYDRLRKVSQKQAQEHGDSLDEEVIEF